MSAIRLFKLPIFLIFLFFMGCAKTNVRTTNIVDSANLAKPDQVLVQDFTVDIKDIQTSSSPLSKLQRAMANESLGAAQTELGHEVSNVLANELTEKIKALGFNVVRISQPAAIPQGAILITGRFSNINEGNAIRRNVIGLGLGQSSVDSEVHVFAPLPSGDNEELIHFNAHTDSGEMPGAAVMGPVGAAAGAGNAAVIGLNAAKGAASTYKSASAKQAKKLAENIAGELAKYFARQGWIKP